MRLSNPSRWLAAAIFLVAVLTSCATAAALAQVPSLDDYLLTGRFSDGEVTFNLHARATSASGQGEITLLSGPISLLSVPDALASRLELRGDALVLKFDGAKELAVDVPFRVQVKDISGWKSAGFIPAAANIRSISLKDWPASADVELPGASQTVHDHNRLVANLPGTGPIVVDWKEAPPATAGKLFFSAEGAVLDTIAPGILRQTDQITLHVLQGNIDQLDFNLLGDGEVTRVDGAGILNWSVAPGDTGQRRLTVRLNAPQSGDYPLTVQLETPLPPLPANVTPPRLAPVGASSYGGRLRVQNDGAVRLEISDLAGLSQIAPEQFPVPRAERVAGSSQAFAYRFADAGYGYTVRADNVLPEVSVDGVIVYHAGDTDSTIDAEFDLDIREAPVRELSLLVPADWSIAGLEAPFLADYFLTPVGNDTVSPAGTTGRAVLRLVFNQPLSDRQVVRLRLERNTAPVTGDTGDWALPPIMVDKVKSARGFVGVTCDASLRVTPGSTDQLTDAGPTTFPRRVDNLQAAWRFTDAPWSATLHVERLAASVQADVAQIFSIGDGLVYGSTVLNLNIAGAPVSVLRLQNTAGYNHVFFTGRDVLNWKLDGDTFDIYLSRPASGAYTLLATYDLPFKPAGDAVSFTGLRPLGVQSEQGHILIASNRPLSIGTTKISDGLVPLESAEIPVECRLMCDAPILACYQYSARPFDATLQLLPLAAVGTVDQVIDIAELSTKISATGEIMTTARYLLKSKDHDHLQVTLPAGAKAWKVTVAGQDVLPVSDQSHSQTLLVPLPRAGDPNTPLLVELVYAGAGATPDSVTVNAPQVHAPVLVTDWQLLADADHSLRSLDQAPVMATPHLTGLAWLGQVAFGSSSETPTLVNNSPAALPLLPPDLFADERTNLGCGLLASFAALLLLQISLRAKNFLKLLGIVAGVALGLIGLYALAQLGVNAPEDVGVTAPTAQLRLSIPMVAADRSLSFALANEPTPTSPFSMPVDAAAWLLLPGLALVLVSRPQRGHSVRTWLRTLGWLLLLAGVLSLPRGPMWFSLFLIIVFGGLILRTLRAGRIFTAPRPAPVASAAPIVAALALFLLLTATPAARAADTLAPAPPSSLVVSITQQGSVQDDFVRMHADLTWRAEKNAQLTLLRAPAILTDFKGPGEVTLSQSADNANSAYVITANAAGTYKISFAYQAHTSVENAGASSVALPTPGGLVNQVTLDLARADLDAASDNAVSVRSTPGADNHPHVVAIFPAGVSPALRWSPRVRDLSAEKPVYYADWQQIYVPAAGVIDGLHVAQIRLAQGEIKTLAFSVPANLTISQVDAANLSAWRFDPDQHKLLVYFDPAGVGSFNVTIHSQSAATPLPYTAALEPLRLDGAAGEVGLLAAATDDDVQVDSVTASGLASINLDDFPVRVVRQAAPSGETCTVRRAFSYGATPAALKLEALAVEPDVRVDSLQRLALGEDRIVLAAHLVVNVTRAGIFKLSFFRPAGLDLVESISGDQLSQWTESDTPDGHLVTLNLKDKTLGSMTFDITLSGPGLASRQNWTAPHLALREASRQTGELALLPELGLRPHILTPVGVAQVDPASMNIDVQGALVFRLLQDNWSLAFDIEKIDPWIQADALQDVTVREGLTEVRANINYEIDNAGVRELHLQLPAAAMGVHIAGDLVADSAPVTGQAGQWLVSLQRRSIGPLSLSVTYQLPPAGADNQLAIAGIQALDAKPQRGFVDLRSRGRLETRVATLPSALQAADWESVPPDLRRDMDDSAPSQVFSVLDAGFTLPVTLVKHEAADVLPAHVVSTSLRSLISPEGQLLTAVTVRLFPGDKRNLSLRLPGGSTFWFAFVNDKGVTPSLDRGDSAQILLPLEPNPIPTEPATVEFLYQQPWSATGAPATLPGPRFDLPLQDISWALFVPESWRVTAAPGPWQEILPAEGVVIPAGRTLDDYQNEEMRRLDAQTKKAETFLERGNELLQQGQQMQARDLFDNAYQISQKDTAFNEDARVQWQNLREQQALVGLANNLNTFSNNNGHRAGGGGGAPQAASPVLSQNELLNFTDGQARKILANNGAEDNAELAKLAESLVKQQAATTPQAVAIRAILPERGRMCEFTRSLLVNPDADLSLAISVGPAARSIAWAGVGALALLGLLIAGAGALLRRPIRPA